MALFIVDGVSVGGSLQVYDSDGCAGCNAVDTVRGCF